MVRRMIEPAKAYRAQGYLFVVAALSALCSLSAKSLLASTTQLSRFLDFSFFLSNFAHAELWAKVYWFSSGSFLGSLSIAIFVELAKRRP